jgi:hypothetical protein
MVYRNRAYKFFTQWATQRGITKVTNFAGEVWEAPKSVV